MNEQQIQENIPFCMFYAGVAALNLIACCYLLLRRGNAFAPDTTPPLPLRRWAAALFAAAFLSHVWWYLFDVHSGDIHSVYCVMVAVPDCVSLFTTIAGTLLAMLQDRKRPVWPFVIGTAPYAAFMVLNLAYPESHYINIAIAYILLFYALFTIYMIHAVRQYGRWLRDNYADLEHKEVWVSHVLAIIILILIISEGFDDGNLTVSYVVQVNGLVLTGFLLWRVETLPQLENVSVEQAYSPPAPETAQEPELPTQAQQPLVIPSNIGQLLAERCVGTQLYLQHDLTLSQLAQVIGTNRFYLSQYFSRQGMTYNAYINNLRIDHFISLYRETASSQRTFTAQQLAHESGFRSYSTFGNAFKQRMGQTVTAWTHETDKSKSLS